MAKTIPVGGGLFALVDDEDYESLIEFKWIPYKAPHLIYAVESKSSCMMHRIIMGNDDPRFVDHKSSDGLDNRRSNLRFCLHKENMRNRRKLVRASSRFKGVRRSPHGTWRAEIQQNGAYLHLGTFEDEVKAARLYDKAAKVFFGAFARTNESLGLY